MPVLEMIKKQFIAKAEVDSEEGTVTAIISTSAPDRDREVLLAKGADFTAFEKNPVVLWAHSHSSPPIGKALWIKRQGKKIIAKIKFADTPFAEEVFSLFKGGFLKAFSVGFDPKKSHQPTPKDIAKDPEMANVFRIFDEWELLEFSAVPVPANAEALAIAVKSLEIKLSDDLKSELEVEEVVDAEDVKIANDSEDLGESEPISMTAKEFGMQPIIEMNKIKFKMEKAPFECVKSKDYVKAELLKEMRKVKGCIY